ncbi:MAG: hypothetical protein QG639_594 [Patescibacteria group bacterium]|nr:hypothetical protein [Patescibacteria group bacterium]
MKPMSKLVYFLAIILILTMAAMSFYIWQNEQDKATMRAQLEAPVPTPILVPSTVPETPTASTSAPIELLAASGTISGSVSFPSETIPEMEVCAEDVESKQTFCTTEILEDSSYSSGVGYKLEVPVGTYHVYAKLPNDPYKAYYNEFVTCGLQASCTSHELIPVQVGLDQNVTQIDPQDWYNQ